MMHATSISAVSPRRTPTITLTATLGTADAFSGGSDGGATGVGIGGATDIVAMSQRKARGRDGKKMKVWFRSRKSCPPRWGDTRYRTVLARIDSTYLL